MSSPKLMTSSLHVDHVLVPVCTTSGSVSSRSSSSGGSSAWCGGGNGNGSSVSTSCSYLVRVHAQVMMRDDSRGGWLPRGSGGLSNVSVLKRVIHYHTPASSLLSVHHHHGTNTSSSSTTSNPPLPPLPSSNQQPQQHHHQHPRNHHHPLHHHHHHHGPATSSSQPSQQHLDGPTKEYLIYGKMISDESVVLSCSIRKDFEYYKVMPTFHHWRTGDHKFGLTFQTAADARAFDRGVRQAVKELMDGSFFEEFVDTWDISFLSDVIKSPPSRGVAAVVGSLLRLS
ncbi:WH1/EVH1 domain [Trinorchestia longiramus]|nr:WH1/EVH1 domain [Trinorchestia longiramus]